MTKKNLLTESYLKNFGVSVSKRTHPQFSSMHRVIRKKYATIYRDKLFQILENICLVQLLLQ